MPLDPTAANVTFNDADCVRQSVAGNREAFGRIVTQYQSLICSLTYSATGSLRESEDIAQETFLIAWRRMKELRDAEKLRPWLCGITRNLITGMLRQQQRDPTHGAESLEEDSAVRTPAPSPAELAISSEESAILWRSLERIPDLYREPLILFYREQLSTERVAAALDLSEDTARQRLSRGRKLLQEEVTAFVEGALQRSAPGLPFTAGVLASIPIAASTAGAAALAASGKGAGILKTSALGLAGIFILPVALLSGLYLSVRAALDFAQSDGERKLLKKMFLRASATSAIALGLPMLLIGLGAGSNANLHPWAVVTGVNLAFVTMPVATWMIISWIRLQQKALAAALLSNPPTIPQRTRKGFAYRSRIFFLGLPLINLQFTRDEMKRPEIVYGWITGGQRAVGGLLAFGGVVVAPIAFGSQAVGVIAVGVNAVGLFAVGCYALGVFACGAFAEGWEATGGIVVGWKAAAGGGLIVTAGGTAIAREFASGGISHAFHAGDAAARQFFSHELFFRVARAARPYIGWAVCVFLLPLAVFRVRAHRFRKLKQST